MRQTQPHFRVSDYRFPKRTYVVWWIEVLALFIITIGATILRGLRHGAASAA